MHPLLLPGTHLLRRADGHLQAGLDPTSAVVLPASATTDLLIHRRPEAPDPRDAALARLLRTGAALPDDQAVRRALPPLSPDPDQRWPRHAAAALARRCHDRVDEAVKTQGRRTVVVQPFGHPLAEQLAADVLTLCRRSGLRTRSDAHARPDRDLALLVGVGEPRRELLDPLVLGGAPHLLVRMTEGEAVVGPFVLPGRTACLRCLDAYRTEQDPSWPLLVEQYARAAADDRVDGIPEPLDPALAAVALGWAVRDTASYAEGATPTTWAATVRLSATLEVIDTRRWPTHPACGCSWS